LGSSPSPSAAGTPGSHKALAGYSGTPLPKKLGIKEDARVSLIGAPDGFERTLDRLPDGVTVSSRVGRGVDVIVFFARTRADLARRAERLSRALDPAGGLWIAWPKGSSALETDLTENVVRDVVLDESLVDNKVCAIDEDWSGLRFVVRKDRRAAWPPD
jgi:hypothetical protein